MIWTSDFRKCHWKVKNAGYEVACSGNACVAMLHDMLAKCRILSYGCGLQWENVHTCPKSAPQKTPANRAADCLPLCGFAPGLLPHVRHGDGFEMGRGVR